MSSSAADTNGSGCNHCGMHFHRTKSSKEALLQLRLARRRHELHLFQLSDLLLVTNGEKQPGITCYRDVQALLIFHPGLAAPFHR